MNKRKHLMPLFIAVHRNWADILSLVANVDMFSMLTTPAGTDIVPNVNI
jgi:hypothetical protein